MALSVLKKWVNWGKRYKPRLVVLDRGVLRYYKVWSIRLMSNLYLPVWASALLSVASREVTELKSLIFPLNSSSRKSCGVLL